MAKNERQPASAFMALQKKMRGIDLRRVAGGLTALLVGGLLFSLLVSSTLSQIIIVFVLSVLVSLGILVIAGFVMGFIEISSDTETNEADVSLIDALPEGVLVTDDAKRVLYANAAYRAIAGEDHEDAPTIEQLFAREVAAAEPIYRLTQAIKKG